VDRTVKFWRLSDGKLARTLNHPEGITSVAFSPDGQWLASGSYDRTVRVWRLRDGALERTLTGHGGTVWSVAFSPDGQRLASCGEDKTVKLWRSSDGAALQTSSGHNLNVWAVAFSPDGRWLASGGRERSALGTLWKQIAGVRRSGARGATVRLWRVSDESSSKLSRSIRTMSAPWPSAPMENGSPAAERTRW
jgi:WD40 repeat protein